MRFMSVARANYFEVRALLTSFEHARSLVSGQETAMTLRNSAHEAWHLLCTNRNFHNFSNQDFHGCRKPYQLLRRCHTLANERASRQDLNSTKTSDSWKGVCLEPMSCKSGLDGFHAMLVLRKVQEPEQVPNDPCILRI